MTAISRARVAIALVVVAAALAAGGALRRGGGDVVGHARTVVLQDRRFVNGPTAGSTFADLSRVLLVDARSCARHRSAGDPRCAARFSAAAYTSVTAFTLLGCTQPGVFQARRGLLAELNGIVALDHRRQPGAAPPGVPGVPSC